MRRLALFLILAFTSVSASALCPDAGLFSRGGIVSQLCWSCFFPITVGPVPIGVGPVPADAAGPVCVCPGAYGIPTPGVTVSMWQPTHVLESVRTYGCSPTLGGATIGGTSTNPATQLAMQGGYSAGDGGDEPDAFYHFHLIAFPVGVVLDLLTDAVCTSDTTDVDLLFASELLPTWNNDELALFMTPEAVLFASPPGIAACLADATASSVAQPLNALYWCFGTWGNAFPYSGNTASQDSPPRDASLAAARGAAAMHRLGLLNKTMGTDAVCADHPFPNLPKTQYRFQMAWPVPEVTGNHWIGASTFRWGEWRNVPTVGEDFVNVLWTYQQCCAN